MSQLRIYSGMINKLNDHQVFVFGSNLDGFHGAGAAGYASFGIAGNQWRTFNYGAKPDGWRGRWNVKGVAEGLQEGTEGKSYALPTVAHAGRAGSFTKDMLKNSIKRLYRCASEHPEMDFLIAYTAEGGKLLNGYTLSDMAECFASFKIPSNIVFEEGFAALIDDIALFM